MREWLRRVLVGMQWLLPQHTLSRTTGWLADRRGTWVERAAMRAFVQMYGVDMREAEHPALAQYASFNAFFTRALKPGARPLPVESNTFVSPADGTISACGALHAGRLLQAKGIDYGLLDLCDGDGELAARFAGGRFVTIYLAPRDYHRVHLPWSGHARLLRYVPGRLFAVNRASTACIPRLFCRNERMLMAYEGEHGWFALIMVGALNVGSIELVHGACNRPPNLAVHTTLALDGRHGSRGDEFGRFNLGSTVIVLASPGWLELDPTACRAGQPVRMGAPLGRVSGPSRAQPG